MSEEAVLGPPDESAGPGESLPSSESTPAPRHRPSPYQPRSAQRVATTATVKISTMSSGQLAARARRHGPGTTGTGTPL